MTELHWVGRAGADCLLMQGEPLARLGHLPSAGLAEHLPVYPAGLLSGPDGPAVVSPSIVQPMAGAYSFEAPHSVLFRPRFPFVPGTEYAVVVRASFVRGIPGEADILRLARPSPVQAPATSVLEIHPVGDEVPRNLLRLYVEFSGPMSEGYADSRIQVVDPLSGAVVVDALLPMEPELWDPRRGRLTVLFDPGRIKQGLAPHAEAGYPLSQGRDVEVVVSETMRDAVGLPLVTGARRRYRVGPDLRGRIDPGRWLLLPPPPGSRSPLSVCFDRPLDHALVQRCLVVCNDRGRVVPGDAVPIPGGRRWEFRPGEPWASGSYRLMVDPVLEDVSGNSVRRPFDRDIERRADDPLEAKSVTVPFGVR